jgi:coenzyme F420-0:L-glutamate ligase/coenzyme F420-1:gamma-L-glutamate ligase
VLITDTFGRPWREGLIEVAIGIAGFLPLLDFRGKRDLSGRELHHTVVAVADELAAAAGLLMDKDRGIPAVLVRGYRYQRGEGRSTELLRERSKDLFR